MKIEKTQIAIRDLFDGWHDSQDEGVVAYGGRLDVRPKYQREFVYKDKQRNAVIETVIHGFPLNTMYWVRKEDGNYEVLDGQQRTISICQFLNRDFSIEFGGNAHIFSSLQPDVREMILNYELDVYICEGTDTEKLEWFKTINIAGERLTDQEIRNAVYSGEWLTQAKRYFSRQGCPAMKKGDYFVSASVIRQELLEKALIWIADAQDTTIEHYMALHQHDSEPSELWHYYCAVIEWAEGLFVNHRKEMRSVDWGWLYNRYHTQKYVVADLTQQVDTLMKDVDVTNKSGIYRYVLTGEERWLSIRAFSPSDKRSAYEKQHGVCTQCGQHFSIEEMEADHIIPWSKGGKTEPGNCQMLCRKCNREKGNG